MPDAEHVLVLSRYFTSARLSFGKSDRLHFRRFAVSLSGAGMNSFRSIRRSVFSATPITSAT